MWMSGLMGWKNGEFGRNFWCFLVERFDIGCKCVMVAFCMCYVFLLGSGIRLFGL